MSYYSKNRETILLKTKIKRSNLSYEDKQKVKDY